MRTKFWLHSLKEKRLLGKNRCRWEDNINMDLREIGFGSADWIHLALGNMVSRL
jgi:hypothetical protein